MVNDLLTSFICEVLLFYLFMTISCNFPSFSRKWGNAWYYDTVDGIVRSDEEDSSYTGSERSVVLIDVNVTFNLSEIDKV